MSNNIKKKIKSTLKVIGRSEYIISFITKILRIYIEIVFITSRIRQNIDSDSEKILKSKSPCIITLWHGRLIILPKFMKKFGSFFVLTSSHNDGNYIDKFINLYGHNSIRGSTYQNNLVVTKEIIKKIKKERIVITPDGPRGPRYKVKTALTNIANKYNVPVIPISFSCSKGKVINTWDNFLLPLPFSEISIDISAPIYFSSKDDSRLEKIMLNQMNLLDNKYTKSYYENL
ncbi:MAG: lysophospholipid acyltransferase (LPLAT)-like uncharacterized protein [Candidatus Midichloriaceae bacterium]